MSFDKLTPALRRRILQYVIAQNEELVIDRNHKVDAIRKAVLPPAITRVSRQLHQESIRMFLESNTFVANMSAFNFRPLLSWVRLAIACVQSPPPKIDVHVKMAGHLQCCWQLFDLAENWQMLGSHNIQVTIRDHWSITSLPILSLQSIKPDFDQRKFVAAIIEVAEHTSEDWLDDAYQTILQQHGISDLSCEGLRCSRANYCRFCDLHAVAERATKTELEEIEECVE